MQRPAVLSCRDFCVGPFRLRQRQLSRQRDHAPQLRVELLDALQINLSQPLRGQLTLLDPPRKLRHRRKCDIHIIRRKWTWISLPPHKLLACWTHVLSRQRGLVPRPQRHRPTRPSHPSKPPCAFSAWPLRAAFYPTPALQIRCLPQPPIWREQQVQKRAHSNDPERVGVVSCRGIQPSRATREKPSAGFC